MVFSSKRVVAFKLYCFQLSKIFAAYLIVVLGYSLAELSRIVYLCRVNDVNDNPVTLYYLALMTYCVARRQMKGFN